MKFKILLLSCLAFISCQGDKTPASKKPVHKQEMQQKAISDSIKTFYWITELCSNQGDYNPKKYNVKQLNDTYHLWFETHIDLDDPTYRNGKQLYHCVVDEAIKKLDRRYDSIKKHLEALTLVNDKKWEDLRQSRLRELKENYDLVRLKTRAYCDPKVLLERSYGPDCDYYVVALTSGQDVMMEEWEKLVRKKMENNAAPQNLYNKYLSQRDSGDSLFYAMDCLLSFGFGNCANGTINHSSSYEYYYDDFEQLFTNFKQECDEP